MEAVIFGNNLGQPILDMGAGTDRARLRSLYDDVSEVAGGFRIFRPGGGFNILAIGVEYVASPTGAWVPLSAGGLDFSNG